MTYATGGRDRRKPLRYNNRTPSPPRPRLGGDAPGSRSPAGCDSSSGGNPTSLTAGWGPAPFTEGTTAPLSSYGEFPPRPPSTISSPPDDRLVMAGRYSPWADLFYRRWDLVKPFTWSLFRHLGDPAIDVFRPASPAPSCPASGHGGTGRRPALRPMKRRRPTRDRGDGKSAAAFPSRKARTSWRVRIRSVRRVTIILQ